MTPLKYLSLSLLLFCTVTLTTSCSSSTDKTKAKDTQENFFNWQDSGENLPKPIGYTNDFEYLFSGPEMKSLDSLLAAFDKRTSIQIAVITIDTTMTTMDSLDAYTLKIANTWGAGQKDKNNGVAIGISRAYRKMRIHYGYGIEKILSDAETQEIIDTAFILHFREGEYFQGTWTGLISLMEILEERYKEKTNI